MNKNTHVDNEEHANIGKSCEPKVCYKSKAKAKKAGLIFAVRNGSGLKFKPYECTHCCSWHLTTQGSIMHKIGVVFEIHDVQGCRIKLNLKGLPKKKRKRMAELISPILEQISDAIDVQVLSENPDLAKHAVKKRS